MAAAAWAVAPKSSESSRIQITWSTRAQKPEIKKSPKTVSAALRILYLICNMLHFSLLWYNIHLVNLPEAFADSCSTALLRPAHPGPKSGFRCSAAC